MAKRILLPLAALLAAAFLGGIAAVGAWQLLDETEREPTAAPAATATPAAVQEGESGATSVADVVEQALPGVVHVTVGATPAGETEEPEEPEVPEVPRIIPPLQPRQGLPPVRPQSAGSGFLIDARHVVTNQHVVGSARTVTVRFHDGEEAQARVLGTDASTDVALLELAEEHQGAALPLGSTDSLRIGDAVIAIGSPFGLQGTVTTGIVSALDRDIRAPDGFTIDGAIQTDAALNQGNSGGPLLDAAGRVVGMNAQIATDSGVSSGVGYAIPIETVREIAAELERSGAVEHAYLGVMIEDAPDRGARIAEVVEGSPADRGGLRADDVVVRVGDVDVATADELRRIVADRKPGDELELRIRRDDAEETITVELGARPSASE